MASTLPEGFVYLDTVDPSIQWSLRYACDENMVGKPLPGYHASRVVTTLVAAQRLKAVQQELLADGFSLVVYDAYRPKKAIMGLWDWAQDSSAEEMAPKYFPEFCGCKPVLFEKSYIAKKSNHNRGSTVDVSLIKVGGTLRKECPIDVQHRALVEGGAPLPFLDDGTVDMGVSFDYLGVASHPDADLSLVPLEFHKRRAFLRAAMERHGFVVSPREWWHYWLRDDEPLKPATTPDLDFDIA